MFKPYDESENGIDPAHFSKLRWRCRRGMRELDEAMLAYLENHYVEASDAERADFEALQDMQDPELFRLVSGKAREARYQIILDKITDSLGSTS